MAEIEACGRVCAMATAMIPEPVPMSAMRRALTELLRQANTSSTRCSVSGRGISTPGPTEKGRPKNSDEPVMYWMGSPVLRRATSSS